MITKVLDITNGDALSSFYALPAVHFESSVDSETPPLGTNHGVLHGAKTLSVPELRSGVSRGGAPQVFPGRTKHVQTDSSRLNGRHFFSPIRR
jgi:hypothetical protein